MGARQLACRSSSRRRGSIGRACRRSGRGLRRRCRSRGSSTCRRGWCSRNASCRWVRTVRLRSSAEASGSPTDRKSAAGSLKVVRHVIQAASAINGEIRPTTASLRPEVCAAGGGEARSRMAGRRLQSGGAAHLVRARARAGRRRSACAGGAASLQRPVVIGDRWKVGDAAAKGVSGYDTGHGEQP